MRHLSSVLAPLLVLSMAMVLAHGYLYNDVPFAQLEVSKFLYNDSQPLADWKQLPFTQVIDAVSLQSSNFLVLTPFGLYRFSPKSGISTALLESPSGTFSKVSIFGQQVALLTTDGSLYKCVLSSTTLKCQQFTLPKDKISVVKYAENANIYLGGGNLYIMRQNSQNIEFLKAISNISSIDFYPKTNTLAVGASRLLWRHEILPKRSSPSWRFYRVDGLIDAAITSLSFAQNGTLYIGNKEAVNSQNLDLTFTRYGGGSGGLPYGNISQLVVSPTQAVWMGTKRGVVSYANNKFKYYNGPRYMTDKAFGPGNVVQALAVGLYGGHDSVLVATGTGLSWIYFKTITLKDKADYFQTLITPYHNRYGLTSSSDLTKWGDRASYQLTSSENDGLWTSMYLASQALRYAVTGSPDAKAEADRALSGLELLNNVTGVAGLFARSVLFQDTLPGGHLPWRFSTSMPGWVWQGDTSSDEVTGHMFAYTLYHQLVALTAAEKMKAARLMTDCMTYVIKNDLYLMDVTGRRTRWGVWNPKFINDDPEWFDQRGLNSVQIMSWISAAQTLASANGLPTAIYAQALSELITEHEYDINVINTKIAIPNDDNYSDDELTFLPYYTYLLGKGSILSDLFYKGMDRTYEIVKTYKSPLWIFMYGASLQTRAHQPFSSPPSSLGKTSVANAIETLQIWPMSWIDWPTDNTQRLDIIISQYLNRNDHRDFVTLLPYDEIDFFRWNTDPYIYQPQGSGHSLHEPTAWLLPYWLGRYHSIISAPTSN